MYNLENLPDLERRLSKAKCYDRCCDADLAKAIGADVVIRDHGKPI